MPTIFLPRRSQVGHRILTDTDLNRFVAFFQISKILGQMRFKITDFDFHSTNLVLYADQVNHLTDPRTGSKNDIEHNK